MRHRIISIGTLSSNEFWEEQANARTPHATCVLLELGDRRLLVDPGLPPEAIAARLGERAGLNPDQIDEVFLTNFRPAHRMGLEAFADAEWQIAEREREEIGRQLVGRYEQESNEQTQEVLRHEIALLKKCSAAPDRLAEGVDLFPMSGYTPGTCGLILSYTHSTVLIAGDAVPSSEHLENGRVLRSSWDANQARESLAEAIHIADAMIPGHDNVVLNPTKMW
jgi:glyoxylase-like metal-dependent hydrolase (beta-lactamase superfamily II)